MKPRRDITLGEMQDSCVAYDCDKCDPCFKSLCALMTNELGEMKAPKFWNLSDPPRFNEAQMALMKALWDIGAKIAYQLENTTMFYRKAARDEQVAIIYNRGTDFALQDGETLDLAELLGKENK